MKENTKPGEEAWRKFAKENRSDSSATGDVTDRTGNADQRTERPRIKTVRHSFNPNFTADNRLRDESGDERKPFRKSYGDHKPYGEHKSYGDKPYGERKSFGDRKPYGNKPYGEHKSYGDKPYGERKQYGDKPYKPRYQDSDDSQPRYGHYGDKPQEGEQTERRQYGDKQYGERKQYGDRKPYGNKPYGERKQYGDKPYGERKSFGDRKPYGNKPYGERKQYGDKPYGERKQYGDKPYGERKSFGDRKPYGNKPYGERRQYGDKPYGERKSYEDKRESAPRTDYPRYDAPAETGEVRLNKYIARAGLCSRREADEYIAKGLVTVNGKVVTEMGVKVQPTDEVKFNDTRLTGEKLVYVLMNKPKGFVTTIEDPHADKTVMDLVKNACTERIYPVGRLDKSSVGVLLLTNDGELTKQLTHPQYNHRKVYEVTLDKAITDDDLDKIVKGITLEDGDIAADEVSTLDETRKSIGIEIHSGRNRIVRRIFEHLGYVVTKLDRVYFAGLTKKNLKRGAWRFLTDNEVSMLKSGRYE